MSETVKPNPLGVEPVGKLILKFAVPSTIALIINALYNIVDQIFIGNIVGYLGNAATNIIFPLTVFSIAIPSLPETEKRDQEVFAIHCCSLLLSVFPFSLYVNFL